MRDERENFQQIAFKLLKEHYRTQIELVGIQALDELLRGSSLEKKINKLRWEEDRKGK